jgi:hypothetical protein
MGGGDAHKIAPPPIPAAARKDEMPATTPGTFADRSPVMRASANKKALAVKPQPLARGLSMLNHNRAVN